MSRFTHHRKIVLLYYILLLIIYPAFSQYNNTLENINRNITKEYYRQLSFSHPASVAFLDNHFLRFSFQNKFLLKELMNKEVGGGILFNSNALLFHFAHFGYNKFGNGRFSMGYSKAFAQKIALGLQFHYLFEHALQYAARHSLTFDFSLFAKVTDDFSIGLLAYNPAKLKYGFTEKATIPMLLDLHFFYKLNEKCLIKGNIEKSLPGNFNLSLGMDWLLRHFIFSGNVSLTYLDFSIKSYFYSFCLDINTQYHYQLGFSPTLSLYYIF